MINSTPVMSLCGFVKILKLMPTFLTIVQSMVLTEETMGSKTNILKIRFNDLTILYNNLKLLC